MLQTQEIASKSTALLNALGTLLTLGSSMLLIKRRKN